MIRLPDSDTNIRSGWHVPAHLWDQIAIFWKANCFDFGSVRGPIMQWNMLNVLLIPYYYDIEYVYINEGYDMLFDFFMMH